MAEQDPDDHVRRQLRTLQRVVGGPTDAVLARRSGVAAATFSEVMSGKRRPREEFVAKVVSGCLVVARASGHAPLDERRVLRALRLPGHTASDSGILERDDDLSRCSAVLESVRTRAGATIVVEGPAGIGKSEVVARVCAEAAVRGIVPLAVRGNQRDRTLAFGAARTLLARWVAGRGAREREALFAGAAAFARVPLGLPHPRGTGATSVIGLTEALYWLVVNATSLLGAGHREDGLLLAVDDAHWVDDESLHWLEFLGDRLSGLPVVLLLANRPHEGTPAPARIALHAAEVVRPLPLGPDAVRTIVGHTLLPRRTTREPDARFCAELLRHSGGNPFYLRWMLDVARERGLAPTAVNADAVGTLTPRHVVLHVAERLHDLGPAARRLAHAIAVLGPGRALRHAARLAHLTPDEAKLQYDRLCAAAILHPGPAVDFRHPIIRAAVYDAIDPSRRGDAHLAAAELLHGEDADAYAVAAHLLAVHPAANPWVVERMTAVAASAAESGLSATAARYLKRAIDEPPPASSVCRVRLRYGQALALGEVAVALPELRAAYDQAPDDVLLTEAAIALAKTHGYADQLGDAVRLLDAALDRCRDEPLRERLLAEQVLWATWWADDPLRSDRTGLLDRIAPALPGTTHPQRLLITAHAWSLVQRGEPLAGAVAAVERVVRRGVVFADADQGMEVATMTAFVHLYSEHQDIAHDLFDQGVDEFDRHGWHGTHLAFAHTNRGQAALLTGRLADAVADADIALRIADRSGTGTPAQWFATGTLVQALLARGDVDRAAAVCAARNYRGPLPDALILPVPRAVLGALLLARGDHDQAVGALREACRWLDAAPLRNPAVCPAHLDLALALRFSAPHEAHEIAVAAHRRAERFGNTSTSGQALRVLAALRPDTELDLLEESARLLENSPNRWQRLLTLTDLGSAFLRSDRAADARRTLGEALVAADECGAVALRDVVARGLGRTGVTPDGPKPVNLVSPRLRRVAHLAAEGRSEADIAHRTALGLDTTTALVHEAHERFGATSRAELRRALHA
ncbi:AAA family ATPase [Umezawaea endophytica]|uniref:AAA family ATPase n=1 Tax=Umezawaea endophytica TaxID=1654476 RepID=A0A9X2ZXQ2_9PSEU|nr:AAA family ATPase [Umezawaea endophytica]MCS7475604.1 AAA family ATPase [Umezawaea endophytica]